MDPAVLAGGQIVGQHGGEAARTPDSIKGGTGVCASFESMPTWAQVLDRIAGDKRLAAAVDEMIQAARDLCLEPVARRVYQYKDVGRHRTELVDMALNAKPGSEARETFALAVSEMGTSRIVADEIPLLAAAFRLSGDPVIGERLLDQLTEMATWSPMQRPGWTLFSPDNHLPPDGKDGNWLATGPGVRAIADALDIVPAASMPRELRESLEQLLAMEIASIAEDWRLGRQWFVKYESAYCNQWVLPTEGLVRACLALGREDYSREYELGVRNLCASLDAHDGEQGAFAEGLTYSVVTVASMIHAARAMAVEGDMRAIEHPYLQRFPTWAAHHFQPGETMVNAFDSGWAVRGGYWRMRPLLSALAACTGSRTALWTLTSLAGGPSTDPAGLATGTLPPATDADAPPLFAAYKRATLVTWRDSWDNDGSAVWVRGGHELDAHDHRDRGHVNYVARGHPTLIEAGTPTYGHPHIHSLYTSCVGHNVLQLGMRVPEEDIANRAEPPTGWQGAGVVAPIDVQRLDKEGGHVVVRVDDGYEGLNLWERTVRWDSEELVVVDMVDLADEGRDLVLFRWHLGTDSEVSVERGTGNGWSVDWEGGVLSLDASVPLTVSQKKMPDHTLVEDDQDHLHTCILAQSVEDVSHCTITARFVNARHLALS